jgi:integrase
VSVYRPRKKDGSFATPFWHYDFQRNGRRFHGSTGKTTERAAREIERLRISEADRGLDETTIDGAFARFWREVGQHDRDSDTTFERLERLQDDIGRILGGRGRPTAMAAIDEDVLARYVAGRRVATTRQGKPLKPATINREVQLLRRVMRRATRVWKAILDLPDWSTALLEEPEEHVVDVPPAVEAAILANLREDFRPVVRFLVMTGLRVGSVVAGAGYGPLRPDQVDFDTGLITVRMKSKKPEGRTLRLPITQAMKVLLANEIGRHPAAVFTYAARAARGGRRRAARYPITYTALYSAFKQAAADAGRPELRVHDLRHTAGNRMLAATGNLRITQNQLGHTRVTTTQRYTHPDVEALRAAMEAVHSKGSPEIAPETTAPEVAKKTGGGAA